MKDKPIFFRVKGCSVKTWSPCFLSGEQNGLVNIRDDRDIALCYDGQWYSKKEVEIKDRRK